MQFTGNVVLYATQLSGSLLGVPVTLTPSSPLATILQLLHSVTPLVPLKLTNVTTNQPYISSDSLQIPGLSIRGLAKRQRAASLADHPLPSRKPGQGVLTCPFTSAWAASVISWPSAGVAGGMDGGVPGPDAISAAAFRLLRSTWAAAAQPAPSTTTPAAMSGQRRRRLAFGGSMLRAALTMADATAGASRSCTATPPASTRGAAQARAPSRPRPAFSWALFASGATWVEAWLVTCRARP